MDTRGGRITVLVVDDHRMVAEGLSGALELESDIDVVGTVGSVDEAVAAVRRQPIDVVLMDYRLPDADGASGAQRVKEARSTVQVVMVSSSVDENVVVAAIEGGCSGFVPKDRSVEELAAAVRAAAAGEILISPSVLARVLPRLGKTRRARAAELTERELEVLELLADGLSNAAIAERLVLSVNTVRNHVQNVLTKLGAHSQHEAVAVAMRQGIIRR